MLNTVAIDQEGPYVIEHATVWYVHNGPSTPGGRAMRLDRRRVCGPAEDLAIAFDEEDGTLHKHGTATAVRAWIEDFRGRTAALPPELALPIPIMMTFAPSAETVAELNRCIAVTGRVKRLHSELTAAGRPTLS